MLQYAWALGETGASQQLHAHSRWLAGTAIKITLFYIDLNTHL
jgi:hypothetical protein